MPNLNIPFAAKELNEFCKRWNIRELALFGSALRADFRLDSDLDLLVSFMPDADWSLLDHIQMKLELQSIFQRNVDLISKRALERSANWLLRDEILKTARPLFSQEIAYAT